MAARSSSVKVVANDLTEEFLDSLGRDFEESERYYTRSIILSEDSLVAYNTNRLNASLGLANLYKAQNANHSTKYGVVFVVTKVPRCGSFPSIR